MNITEIVAECANLLSSRYRIVAVLLVGSAAGSDRERALDIDLCVLVHDEVLRQGKFVVGGTPVDVFVCGIERARREIEKGLQQYLVTFFATGRHLWGEPGSVRNLQRLAQRAIAQPAPAPSAASEFTYRHRPHSLLRKLEDTCSREPATSALVAATLVRASVDAYFALNRIWTTGIRDTIEAIASHDPSAAALLRRVLNISPAALGHNLPLLREFVTAFAGEEPGGPERWA